MREKEAVVGIGEQGTHFSRGERRELPGKFYPQRRLLCSAERTDQCGWVWQHATIEQAYGRAGVLQLVPKFQHTSGSLWWRLLHPLAYGGGGYSEWAIPAGAPPNS
jgi:hypothetical protein